MPKDARPLVTDPMPADGGSDHDAPSPAFAPLAPLALQMRRASCSVVGRPTELQAIEQELAAAARGRLVALTLEGEPGIGKTRLVVAAAELAARSGFAPIVVTADEELRGPFLLARSMFACEAARQAAQGTGAAGPLQRALDAMAGIDEPGLENLPSDAKLLRTFDLAALALRGLAVQRPVALLIDDLQWADEDSLRLLRYVLRTDAASPIFLLLAMRPAELAFVNEAVTLIADMERMGLVRRLRLSRFSQVESTEFARLLLGGQVNLSSAAAMHAQSEGVPFIVEELAHAYRDTGLLQQIDGVWTLSRNAERLVPSAVRTLIQRRAARLPDAAKTSLAEAAVLGRSFSLRDLLAIKAHLGDDGCTAQTLAEALVPAVDTGLLTPHPEGSPADYSFTHEQVREFALASLTAPRRRAIHGAVVDLLTSNGEPARGSLPLLARHALAAGDAERAARFSIEAAHAALEAHAPEEVLRLVEQALPAASAAQERVALLSARDRALEMVRRSGERMEGLAELGALAEALGDSHLELEVMLRRAAALRVSEEFEAAVDLCRRVRTLAGDRGDREAELAACLEMGQAMLRSPIGESFSPTGLEVDFDGAEEAYGAAVALAEELGDEASLAAALRELGTVSVGRARDWFMEQYRAGTVIELMHRVAAGETLDEILLTLEVAPLVHQATERYERALGLYERMGDRRGVMSTVIAMAYINWAPEIHFTSSARRIEEIRRLASSMNSLTTESERALAELQMLYGVHVYARAKVVPDLSLSRGEDAFRAARALGDRSVEFLSAGGMALAHIEMREVAEAEAWLGRAAAAAQASPTPLRARQLEAWRGMARAAAGDAEGMREHLERAVRLATDQGRPAARCEALALLALEAARLGAEREDEELLALAERSAADVKALIDVLPGHPMWGAQADAAMARVLLARGDPTAAAVSAAAAVTELQTTFNEDLHLEILLPSARAIEAGAPPEMTEMVREYLQLMMAGLAQRTLDEDVRVRWFRSPVGRELAELAGPAELPTGAASGDGKGHRPGGLEDADVRLLRLIIEGKTNRAIADELAITEDEVVRRLASTFAKIGATSRADATVFVFREHL